MNQFLFPMIMLAMVAWMFYSQRKQQKKQQEKMNAIQKGDEVVTIGGLYGIVDEIDDKKVVLDVDGVYLTFARFAIRERVTEAKVATTSPVETTTETIETAVESNEE
ncbi:preprotein translocase subunit YajC [Streptococcus gallolyticus]|uniref:preprotein translocase subunit YajC n=1 Tax=Streptococcus hepaticus TaxID=3349163 RepID=UPI001C96A0C0|nr:preprotein translocase subunit YajC [Streptococcus gallolyticus]MBY5040348.1 preprotein translocase subunit YajC [Streptococcus gallolyticus]